VKTIQDIIQDAIGKDAITKCAALKQVVKYYSNEPTCYWKAATILFSGDVDDIEDSLHWLEGDIADMENEIHQLKMLMDMLKS